MSTQIHASFSDAGISRILKALDEYEKEMRKKADKVLDKAAERAADNAQHSFDSARYAGTNDVEVKAQNRGDQKRVVVATGNATLFIEFGTGVTYPDDHPEKPSGIAGRGEFGKGHGKRRAWGYYGDPGNMAPVHRGKGGSTLIVTRGNPANRCMYEAEKELEQALPEIIREVFR